MRMTSKVYFNHSSSKIDDFKAVVGLPHQDFEIYKPQVDLDLGTLESLIVVLARQFFQPQISTMNAPIRHMHVYFYQNFSLRIILKFDNFNQFVKFSGKYE